MGPIRNRTLLSALRGLERDGGDRQHAHRLEGDAGGARVQSGSPGAEEGRGEGGDRGGEGASDQRPEDEGEGGQERQVAPRGA